MASSTETNPLYNQWRKTDDLFSSWINSTLKEPILAGLDTATEAWSLESSFASKNHDARNLQQLRIQLHHMQKGNSTITDYLSKIKNISDSLAAASQPVSGLDLVLHSLRGLGPEYDGFKIAITARPSLPTFSELYDLLFQQEIQIDHDNLQRIPPPCDKPVGEEEETEKQKNGVPFTKSSSSILKTSDQDNGDVPKSIIKITRRVVKKDENINNVTSSVAAACDKVAAGSNSLKAGKEEVKTKFKGVLQRKGGKWAADIRKSPRIYLCVYCRGFLFGFFWLLDFLFSPGCRMWLGTFNTAEEAKEAYDKAAREFEVQLEGGAIPEKKRYSESFGFQYVPLSVLDVTSSVAAAYDNVVAGSNSIVVTKEEIKIESPREQCLKQELASQMNEASSMASFVPHELCEGSDGLVFEDGIEPLNEVPFEPCEWVFVGDLDSGIP